jgi:class 3 adenylate cyclase
VKKTEKIYHVSWSYDFKLTVDQLWDAISNTDRLNRGLGLPCVTYEHKPKKTGGVDTFASFKLKGLVISWREHPYEWVKGKYFEIERDYLSGPMKNVVIRWEIQARPDGGSTLVQKIRYTLKHWAFWPIAAFQFQVEAKLTVFGIYKRLNKQAGLGFTPEIDLKPCPPLDKKVKARWIERMRQASIEESRASTLLGWVLKSSPSDLIKIRPFRLAKELNWTTSDALTTLLRATDAGVFLLNWGLLCPGCRGTKMKKQNLSELPAEGHCNTCNIQFDPDFSKNIELTFKIAPAICKVIDVEYCAGGPQNTPHSLAQLRLKPGQKYTEQLALSEGTYQIRSLQSPSRTILNFSPASPDASVPNHAVQFVPVAVQSIDQVDIAANAVNLSLQNDHAHEIVATVERADWLADICSAFNVVNTKEFRELFPTQVISKSVEFQISSIAIMFTDLKDSTSMYEKIGDAQALDIVVSHLENLGKIIECNNGFVVKTIGDAVMAVFQQPENATQSAIDIQNFYLAESKANEASDLHVKIGIHKGSCFAVNLNERNDFFGGTVNIAARTQSKSGSDEIILSAKMVEDPGVKEVLHRNHCQLRRLIVPLKGLAGEYELYELKFSQDQHKQSA